MANVKEMLTKMSPREKKIAVLTGVLLMVMVGFHGVWMPVTDKLDELNDQIFALQLKMRKAKTLIRQREDVKEEAKKFPNLEKMEAGSDEEEIANLLALIEQTARKTKVSLSDVKPEQVQSDKVSKRYRVELNAESGITELIRFVFEIERSQELLKVEAVDSTPKEEESSILRSSIVVTRVVVL